MHTVFTVHKNNACVITDRTLTPSPLGPGSPVIPLSPLGPLLRKGEEEENIYSVYCLYRSILYYNYIDKTVSLS